MDRLSAGEPATDAPPPCARSRTTILLIEDEETTRTEIARILRGVGYAVIPTRCGVEAQWCVERHGPEVDLILADFAGPEADGYHLGIPVGALLPHAPILFISGRSREESIRRGLLHPRSPYLQKPFPPSALTRVVRAVLARRGARRAI